MIASPAIDPSCLQAHAGHPEAATNASSSRVKSLAGVGMPQQDRSAVAVNPWEHAIGIADCVEEIRHLFIKDRTNTMELARVVCAAKAKLPYGQWSRLSESGQLPFSKRTGEMLAFIGQKLGSLAAQTSARLPQGWNTIYELARLDRVKLEELVQQQIVHPRLSLNQARELVARLHGARRSNSHWQHAKRRFGAFREFVLTMWIQSSATERAWLRDEMGKLQIELDNVLASDSQLRVSPVLESTHTAL